MPIQRMVIDQQFGQIGIRSSHARMQIGMPKGQMSFRDNKAQLQVDTQIPRFRVPRERLRRELGLAGPVTFAKEFRDKGKMQALRAIGTYAADGDFIANPHIPGDKSIPMLTANKMKRFFQKPEVNIGLIPSSTPSLDWDKGRIDINFTKHNFAVDWNGSNRIDVSVDTGYPVEVFLSRQHYFRVASIEPAVQNKTLGRFIDRSV